MILAHRNQNECSSISYHKQGCEGCKVGGATWFGIRQIPVTAQVSLGTVRFIVQISPVLLIRFLGARINHPVKYKHIYVIRSF